MSFRKKRIIVGKNIIKNNLQIIMYALDLMGTCEVEICNIVETYSHIEKARRILPLISY